jgi:hypothetical protein
MQSFESNNKLHNHLRNECIGMNKVIREEALQKNPEKQPTSRIIISAAERLTDPAHTFRSWRYAMAKASFAEGAPVSCPLSIEHFFVRSYQKAK